MSGLVLQTAADLAGLIAAGEVSAHEVVAAHFERIAQVEPQVQAFLALDEERALAAADRVDAKLAAGEKLGPLAGVPLGLKDIFTYQGLPCTVGSRILEGWHPPYDATVVKRLLDADLIIVGKVNMDEFAMGSSTESSAYKVTHNPWNLDYIPGGSSGGSAAALAAFEVALSVGTDTGGSIRQPAAVNSLVGVKPTYGSNSRFGVVAMASSLDVPGPFGRTVLDAALLHEAISGYDPMDSTSLNLPIPPVAQAARSGEIKGYRIGVVKELGGEGYAPGVLQRFNESLALLESAGAEIAEISCPHFTYALGAYYLIMPSEVSSNLARFDAMRYGIRVGDDGKRSAEEVMNLTRGAGFGAEVKRRVIIGTYALSAGYYDAYYGSALKVRTLIQQDFDAAFAKVDVLVSPTSPTTAWKIGERLDDPLAMYKADLCTIPANLAGICAASIPVGLSSENGLPVGFQIMAPAMADDRLYRVGAALERGVADAFGGPVLNQLIGSPAWDALSAQAVAARFPNIILGLAENLS
ncbi:MAG: Asp-tRNA(Asn)/Glu-tRNA(Gln) amidotransferase subunit GatA [Propionibacteriaceae bacterium]|jgi:aspartyl-tRNA(Asn)/glutamyl-tRNA(Gln) amidotransferase subunit A|nr:Asp-tRNA(Asn)/Glu-tRNA(Gln) amidotransferase subunit GatA [Propionibacteriaceae bacterium]